MTKKEKVRFAAAIVLSATFVFFSILLLDAAFAEVFMMPSKMTETFYGFVLFAVVMAAIALLLIGIGTLSVGALGAFFAYSFWKYSAKTVRIMMRSVFVVDVCFLVMSLIAMVILVL